MRITPSSAALLLLGVSLANGQEGHHALLRSSSSSSSSFTSTSSSSRVTRFLGSLFSYSTFLDEPTVAVTPEVLTYQGVGNEAGAVAVFRTGGGEEMQEEMEMETREGTGVDSPKGYCLVEDKPRCYFTLGADYCPTPSSGVWTDGYMSYIERTSQVFANAARMDPAAFQRIYNGNGATYKCSTSTRPPLRYNANANQAAVKQSQILNEPNCPFQHDTCSKFCNLYGGKCGWDARISKYEPNWTGMGENIAMTTSEGAKDPMAAVLQWLDSAPHCSNIFSGDFTHMGTGSFARYWAQNFLTTSVKIPNTLYDGTHYLHSTRTGGKLRFLVSFKDGSAPQNVKVFVNGASQAMSLHLGSATQGLYSFDQTKPSSGCLNYYFTVTTGGGVTHRLPETGSFSTATLNGCTTNWVKEGGSSAPAPAPAPSPPTQATPTRSPTRPPAQNTPTRRPTRTPTRAPAATGPTSNLRPPTRQPTYRPIPPSPSSSGGWTAPPNYQPQNGGSWNGGEWTNPNAAKKEEEVVDGGKK